MSEAKDEQFAQQIETSMRALGLQDASYNVSQTTSVADLTKHFKEDVFGLAEVALDQILEELSLVSPPREKVRFWCVYVEAYARRAQEELR